MKSTNTKSTGGDKQRSSKATQAKQQTPSADTMSDNPLHQAMLDELADLLDAEQQLVQALPDMIEAAASDELRSAIEMHLQETEKHVQRLQEVVSNLGESLEQKTCEAMRGLISEAKRLGEEFEGSPALDAVLISAAQKVEHYEIASYGTVCAWAKQMGHQQVVELLEETLSEEKAADDKLTDIAESLANTEAENEK